MIRVKSHQYKGRYTDALVDAALQFARTDLSSRLSDDPVEAAGVHTKANLTEAGGAVACSRERDALELLQVSCDCAGALFAAISAPAGSQVTFPFRGAAISGPAGKPGYGTGPAAWVTSLLLASALGRADAVATLTAVPAQLFQEAPGERDECFYHLVYAFQAFFLDEDVAEPLAEFERLSRPEHLKVATPRILERFRALGPALTAIVDKNQSSLTPALVGVLEAHKRAFGKGKEAASHAYLIDVHACGIARIARDRGLQIEVESDYMPPWLLNASSP